jgi:hypothetical protein
MFYISGKLTKLFEQPGGKGKDGKDFPSQMKAQIMGELTLKNGEKKDELLTLSVPPKIVAQLKEQIGCDVTLPCGIFAQNNKITPYLTA